MGCAQLQKRAKVSVSLVEEVETTISVAHTSNVELVIISDMQTSDDEVLGTWMRALCCSGSEKELYGIESVMLEVKEIRRTHTHSCFTSWMHLAQLFAYILHVSIGGNSFLIVEHLAKAVYEAIVIALVAKPSRKF